MTGEFGDLNQSSWEQASQQLPQLEGWDSKLQAEKVTYKQGCEASGSKFDPFSDNLYAKPKVPFGPYFVHLARINYGNNTEGAFRLYQTLSTVPEGYEYHGKVEAGRVADYSDPGAKVIGGPVTYDAEGKPMDGYVSIAVPTSIHRG